MVKDGKICLGILYASAALLRRIHLDRPGPADFLQRFNVVKVLVCQENTGRRPVFRRQYNGNLAEIIWVDDQDPVVFLNQIAVCTCL